MYNIKLIFQLGSPALRNTNYYIIVFCLIHMYIYAIIINTKNHNIYIYIIYIYIYIIYIYIYIYIYISTGNPLVADNE